MTKPDEGLDAWADPHFRRAEFRRRLAEKGIFVSLPRTDMEWSHWCCSPYLRMKPARW